MSKMKDTLEDRDYNGNIIPVPTQQKKYVPRREVDNYRTLARLEALERGPLDNGRL